MQRALAPRRRIERRLLVGLAALVALGALLATAPGAGADVFTPESGGGSPQAERTDTLYQITLYMAIPIFLLVEGVLIYSLVRHRARRGAVEPAQVRGNRRLEIGWTVAAAAILVVLTGITFAMLPGIRSPERSGPERAGAVQVAATGQPPVPLWNWRRCTARARVAAWMSRAWRAYQARYSPGETALTAPIIWAWFSPHSSAQLPR